MKIIIALDFDNKHEAFTLIDKLDPDKCALKVGLEMFTLFGADFVKELIAKGFKIFLDLKFFDIPETVARSCRASAEIGVWMLNVHATGGLKMMTAARDALAEYKNDRPLLLGVTLLTSTGLSDLAMYANITVNEQEYVANLAKLAKLSGLDGVVCSATDVPLIKSYTGTNFITVTPGIRREIDNNNDQKRSVTPQKALQSGSDYIVVGRPVTRAKNPLTSLNEFYKFCTNE